MSPYEMSRKYAGTNSYVDLCNHCFDGLDITASANESLNKFIDIEEDDQFDPTEDGYPWEERE